ncbi:MAG: hypothetical protein ACRDT4_06025 [Micromonosporaceae bacterium]
MTTLRIENSVTDFHLWKAAFDAYAAVRTRMGVRRWRVTRQMEDPLHVYVELDFDTTGEAAAFAEFLVSKVWRTPRSQAALARHHAPVLLMQVESGAVDATGAGVVRERPADRL